MKNYKSILLTASMVFGNWVMAAPGDLDPSFGGGNGWVSTGFMPINNDIASGVIQQPDGKLVVAGTTSSPGSNGGDFALARYNADGTLDPSFSGNGKAITEIRGDDRAASIIRQLDGKLVVAGYSTYIGDIEFALARYNSDGSLDISFNGDGKLTTAIGTDDAYGRVVIQQSDGKLVVAGTRYASRFDVAVVRYNADGSLDTSFDGDGKVITVISTATTSYVHTVIQQTDGKLVVGGSSYIGGNEVVTLLRYNTDGSLDTSFDGDGILTSAMGESDAGASSIIQQADGKLVMAGFAYVGGIKNVALARYNADGSLDASFDGDGILTTAIGAGNNEVESVIQQMDGKLVVGGSCMGSSSAWDVALLRYNADGSLDTSFDGDGMLVTAIGTSNDYGQSVIQQMDGKLVVAGYSYDSDAGNNDFAVLRYSVDGSLDPGFDSDGKAITELGVSIDAGQILLQQADGKLVLSGASHNNGKLSIARFNTGGALDTSFSSDGKITTAGRGSASMIQQADGKLLLAWGSTQYLFRRYNLDGTNDTSFGSNGYGELSFNPCSTCNEVPKAIMQLDNGLLVGAGYSQYYSPPLHTDATLFQFQCASGSWNCTSPLFYGGSMSVTYGDEFEAIVQQADGKIVAAGQWYNGSQWQMVIKRYHLGGGQDAYFSRVDTYAPTAIILQSDGKLLLAFGNYKLERFNSDLTVDASFGVNGRVLASDIGLTKLGSRKPVLQQNDGKLVVAGGNIIARLNLDGTLDTSFGVSGKQTLSVSGGSVVINSIVEQFDGKLVVGGYATNMPTGQEYYVARLQNNDLDTDLDGLINKFDPDDDNDTVLDINDAFPLNASEWLDTDNDGTGNNADTDDDNDGVADTADKFPLDANRWLRSRHNTDFDNDSDVLVRSASTGTWTRHSIQNNAIVGNGAINAPTSSDSVYVAQLDANGDGDADILTRSATTGAWTLSIVENGAVTSSVPLYLYANLGYVFVGTGDFNNDGVDDVMLRHATNGYRVFLLANHAVSTSVYYNAWTGASSVDQGIGDFNGDGTDDLLVRRTSDNLYFIFKTINGAVNNYYCACNIWSNTAWTFQFAGDTNKDGIDDIVIRGTGPSADGKWWAFRMNNFRSSLYTNLNLFINKTAITVGAVGDYNGDGNIDVLTRVNNSATYVSPITNGTVGGNYLLYNFTADQVIGK